MQARCVGFLAADTAEPRQQAFGIARWHGDYGFDRAGLMAWRGKMISIGLMCDEGAAVIWRGPVPGRSQSWVQSWVQGWVQGWVRAQGL